MRPFSPGLVLFFCSCDTHCMLRIWKSLKSISSQVPPRYSLHHPNAFCLVSKSTSSSMVLLSLFQSLLLLLHKFFFRRPKHPEGSTAIAKVWLLCLVHVVFCPRTPLQHCVYNQTLLGSVLLFCFSMLLFRVIHSTQTKLRRRYTQQKPRDIIHS